MQNFTSNYDYSTSVLSDNDHGKERPCFLVYQRGEIRHAVVMH